MSQCLIFCRTNLDCDNLETFLNAYGGGGSGRFTERVESGKENPYSCAVLAGMRSMQQRRASLEAFKEGDVRFLICTDVAARGIDVKGLPYIINMTLPDEPENYIHRIGRVGRAEKMGLAISIVAGQDYREKVWYHTCSNRGVGCTRRQLKDQGGCTVWHEEWKMLSAIEARLRTDVLELTTEFELPQSLLDTNVVYGEEGPEENGESSSLSIGLGQTNARIEQWQSSVKELVAMEYEAQNLFLSMTTQFMK